MVRRLAAPPAPSGRPRPLTADQERFFFDNGYLVLPKFVSDEEVAAVNDAVDLAWSDRSIYNGLTASETIPNTKSGKMT
jgi:hypothetical protein